MTDTSLVQGEFAPADTSFAADLSVQTSSFDATVESAVEADVAVTAEPNGFVELGLAPELVQAVADLGYTQPTSVQLKTIPLAMGGGSDATKFIDLMVRRVAARPLRFCCPFCIRCSISRPQQKPKNVLPSIAQWPTPLPGASLLPSVPSARTPPTHAISRQPLRVP